MDYNKRRQNLSWEMVNLKVTIRYKVVSLQSTVKVDSSLKTVSRWNNNNTSNNNVINRKSNFNTITTNLFFSVQLKLFFIDIQTWSTMSVFLFTVLLTLLSCWAVLFIYLFFLASPAWHFVPNLDCTVFDRCDLHVCFFVFFSFRFWFSIVLFHIEILF